MDKSMLTSRNKALEGDFYSNGIEALACEIVVQAIEDWKMLIRRKAWENGDWIDDASKGLVMGFQELRVFFRSDWCELLLTGTEMTGDGILASLEDMLEAAKYGIAPRTWQKIKMGESKR